MECGESFTPEDVKAWLIREGGWNACHAQDAADLAQKVLEHKKLQKGRPHLRRYIRDLENGRFKRRQA
jgi:hypothetical protein